MKLIIAFFICVFCLSGCASQDPNYIKLAPKLSSIASHASIDDTLAITTIDLRKANYVVRFDDKKDAAKLISPIIPPRKQLESLFEQGFKDMGYKISKQSRAFLHIDLDTLLTDVHETLFGYQANTNMIINVVAYHDNRTLSKKYHAKNTRTGPMRIGFSTLESDMNKLMGELVVNIVSDKELNQFLQQ